VQEDGMKLQLHAPCHHYFSSRGKKKTSEYIKRFVQVNKWSELGKNTFVSI
jgi:hypothetical protein